ncbi:hypothetical protein [Haloterrigena salinisoli]|uniref:hypothetical protein n=1 Tax=Haloterrigena salinisoli TaxID=3132747 RepID=UPI0030D49E52
MVSSDLAIGVGGLLLSALGIIITLFVTSFQIGGKIKDFENTIENGLNRIGNSTKRNTEELRDMSESLTKIEIYLQQNNTEEIENDGGEIRNLEREEKEDRSTLEDRSEGSELATVPDSLELPDTPEGLELPNAKQDNRGNSHGQVMINNIVYQVKVIRRTFLTEIDISPEKDHYIIDPSANDLNDLKGKLMKKIETNTEIQSDVEVSPGSINIIVPSVSSEDIEEVRIEVLNILEDNPPITASLSMANRTIHEDRENASPRDLSGEDFEDLGDNNNTADDN